MKIRNYILVVGFLLLGSAQLYAEPSKSLVPYSPTVSSLPSSALSSISTVPVSTASLYTFGGLSALIGGYLSFNWLFQREKKIQEQQILEKQREVGQGLRAFLENKGQELPRNTDEKYLGYEGNSDKHVDIRWRYETEQSRKRCGLDVRGKRTAPVVRSRSVSNTSGASIENTPSLVGSVSRRSSSYISSQDFSLPELSEDDDDLTRPFEILFKRDTNNGYEVEGVAGEDIRRLFKIKKIKTNTDEPVVLSPSELDEIRDQRGQEALIIAQAAAKRREKRENAQTVDDMAGTYQSIPVDMVRKRKVSVSKESSPAVGTDEPIGGETVSVSKKDCVALRNEYFEKGKIYMGLLRDRKECQVPTGVGKMPEEADREYFDTLLSLVCTNNQEQERTVVIKNPEGTTSVTDLFIRYWCQRNQERSAIGLSTYVSEGKNLVVVVPEGEFRQSCILPDGVSHLEFCRHDDERGITIKLYDKEDAPNMEKNWTNYCSYALERASDQLSEAVQWTQRFIGRTAEAVVRGWDRRVTRQGCYLRQAVASGNRTMTLWALANGADIDSPVKNNDGVGLRPLHIAAGSGDVKMTELLLSMGANPCLAAWDEHRAALLPIHIAVVRGDFETVKLLSQDTNACNETFIRLKTGEKVSPSDLAKKYGHVEIAASFFKTKYPKMYEDFYGSPKLFWLNRNWDRFGVDTPEVVVYKLGILDSAYREMLQTMYKKIDKYKEKIAQEKHKKVEEVELADLSYDDLKRIKDTFDSTLIKIDQKKTDLYVVIGNGTKSPQELLRGWSAECDANKLDIEPELYYTQLGYTTWQEGAAASYRDVNQRLQEKKNSDHVSEHEKATILRQIGYFFESEAKKQQFDRFLKIRSVENDSMDEDELVSVNANEDGVPRSDDVDGQLLDLNLGADARRLSDKHFDLSTSEVLMSIKDMQSKINRELSKRQESAIKTRRMP